MSPRLVIVGGGAAGMSAASAARRVDPDLEIVVLEATGHVGYGLCGLPYYVAGLVEGPEELLAYPLSFFRERRHLDVRLHARALDLDSANHVISYEQAGRVVDLAYDRVVVAAGGSPVIPPLAGVNDERVFTVRTLEDAIALRGLVDAGHVGRAVIVGAGYIGLEMAEALRARGIYVVVAEQLPRVLPNLDEPVAALVEEEVRANGVDLRLGAGVREIRRQSSSLHVPVDTAWVAADIVVLAVGVRPAGGLAAAAGADIVAGGALLVDARMRTSL